MAVNNDFIPGFDDNQEDTLKFALSPVQNIPHGMVIVLAGYVDTYNSTFFQNQVQKIIDKGYYNLIFECTNLTGFASTGLGILTALLKTVRLSAGDIVLAGLQPQISETVSLLGFAHFFKIVQSLQEALVSFGVPSPTGQVFPLMLACPCCQRQLRAQHAGRFRCVNCKSIIVISEAGQISLG